MVSAAVLSALPLELPPLLLEMLLVVALACAFEFSELVFDETRRGADRARGRHALDRAARHLRLLRAGRIARRRAQENLVERLRILPVLRRHFHHHEVLVERVVDSRHGALAERVIQHVVDLVRRKAVASRRGAVELDVGLQAVLLQVRVDIEQLAAVLVERGHELRRPRKQRGGIIACQRVLVFGGRLPSADSQILLRLHEKPRAGDLRSAWAAGG